MLSAKQFWVSLVLIAGLLLPLARPTVVTAQQQPPPSVQQYVRPGERLVAIQSPLEYRGVTYQAYYMTTGAYDRNDLSLFYFADSDYFKNQSITGLLLTADGTVVEDEDTLREIFGLFRAAAYLYERTQVVEPLGNIDDSFVESFHAITSNPFFIEQQIKALFSTPLEQNMEALRAILTPQMAPPGALSDFTDEVKDAARSANTIVTAVDQTLEAARFSNSRAVRDTAKEIKGTFKSWKPITKQGSAYVELNNTDLEFANALDVLDLGIQLVWLADLQLDRAHWLDQFEAMAREPAIFDSAQRNAATVVKTEAQENWTQRSVIILQFVKDKGVDLGVRVLEEELAKKWVNWAWKEYGKRSAGHLVAGAASAAFLGLTLGNLLYGLDDLFDNFKTGERADGLRQCFYLGRLQVLTEGIRAKGRGQPYTGELAASFRSAYMLESLAAAQMYRSYADGVEATVRQGLLAILNPVAWFKGKEWRQAAEELRVLGKQVETEAEEALGTPSFIDSAVAMVRDRVGEISGALGATAGVSIVYDVVLSGETAKLDFVVQNSGEVTWSVTGFQFVAGADTLTEAPRVLALERDVPPGGTASWSVSLVASGGTGVRRIHYQMQANDELFGDVVTGYVIVLPPQLKDAEVRIRRQIEEWQQQGKLAAEELVQRILTEVQKEAEHQAQKFLDQLWSQCSSSLLVGVGIVFVGWRARRRNRY